MRTLTVSGAAAVSAACVLLLSAPAQATPPGDNGTVKIHDASTGEELRKNEPHVCEFYVDAFNFDSEQQVDWWIEAWAPTADVKGERVESGSLTLDLEGHARTSELALPDGHYKLFWTFDGEHGRAKHKVFWTDCEDGGKGDEGGAPAPSDAPSPTASASDPAAPAPTSAPSSSPSGQGGGEDLAETGSGAPVAALSVAAAGLVAVGGYLVARRRQGHQG